MFTGTPIRRCAVQGEFTLKKSIAAVIATAAGALVVAGLVPVASAAPVDHASAVTAELGLGLGPLGTLAIPLTGGAFVGTTDDETGDIAGDIAFPETTSTIDLDGTPATATTTIGVDGLVGLIAPDNTVTATGVFRLNLVGVQSGEDDPITFDPCNWSGETTMTGTYDPDTNTLTIAQTGFAFESTTDVCGGLAELLDGYLTADATDLSFTIDLDAPVEPPTTTTTEAPVPTTTAVATTAPSTPAPAAQPVAATASYTG